MITEEDEEDDSVNEDIEDVEGMRLEIDSFGSFDELSQRLQAMANDEIRISELQNLVTIQRKTIANISKVNSELVETVRVGERRNDNF